MQWSHNPSPFISVIVLVISTGPACAGSQFYIGLDAVRHTLETSTTTTYSAVAPPSSGESRETYGTWGLRAGYKFKSRLTDRYFWAPELAVTPLEDSDLIYSTNLRLGLEAAPYEIYTTLGVSRIEPFTDNRLNFGVGLEYRLSNRASFTAEWIGYDTIDETTESTVFIGPTQLDVRTDTERSLETYRIGFTYYFQGSI